MDQELGLALGRKAFQFPTIHLNARYEVISANADSRENQPKANQSRSKFKAVVYVRESQLCVLPNMEYSGIIFPFFAKLTFLLGTVNLSCVLTKLLQFNATTRPT